MSGINPSHYHRWFEIRATAWTGEAIVDPDGKIVPAVRNYESGPITAEEIKEEWRLCSDAIPPTATKVHKRLWALCTDAELELLLKIPPMDTALMHQQADAFLCQQTVEPVDAIVVSTEPYIDLNDECIETAACMLPNHQLLGMMEELRSSNK